MKELQKQVDKLLCNAFIGVAYTIEFSSPLAWYLDECEERMESIDTLIEDLEKNDSVRKNNINLQQLKSYSAKGITEVVLIRGW